MPYCELDNCSAYDWLIKFLYPVQEGQSTKHAEKMLVLPGNCPFVCGLVDAQRNKRFGCLPPGVESSGSQTPNKRSKQTWSIARTAIRPVQLILRRDTTSAVWQCMYVYTTAGSGLRDLRRAANLHSVNQLTVTPLSYKQTPACMYARIRCTYSRKGERCSGWDRSTRWETCQIVSMGLYMELGLNACGVLSAHALILPDCGFYCRLIERNEIFCCTAELVIPRPSSSHARCWASNQTVAANERHRLFTEETLIVAPSDLNGQLFRDTY